VSYLEALPRATAVAWAPSVSDAAAQQLDWRARDAEARAAYLEQELRTLAAAAPAPETAPFAADAGVDTLLRWRMLYLERRMAHLQQREAPAAVAPAHDAAPDPDRWKWRARYLEARVRHLEQRPAAPAPAIAQTPARPPEPEAAPPPSPAPARSSVKPPVMASPRNGAPDDLTMIDAVSQLQQTALYSLGVFHFDQIAAWTPDNVAWVDQYFRLRGRIDEEDWVGQADELARPPARSARPSEVVSP
jgi:predicted flap endonuclease-1-like 5' DNA nuclease